LTATLEKRTPQLKGLNAELVTVVATGFLKRIGHKEVLKLKKFHWKKESTRLK
jgi:hypothetical protein